MKPERLYQLICKDAEERGLSDDELRTRILIAHIMNDIGTDDLHELTYRLAQDGWLDGETLDSHLIAADAIIDENRHK